MDTDGFRKAIHFDLDTATVEATFGKKNTSMAYRKIRKFLESKGFAHSQYSGYMSLRPMSNLEVYRTYDMMKEAFGSSVKRNSLFTFRLHFAPRIDPFAHGKSKHPLSIRQSIYSEEFCRLKGVG